MRSKIFPAVCITAVQLTLLVYAYADYTKMKESLSAVEPSGGFGIFGSIVAVTSFAFMLYILAVAFAPIIAVSFLAVDRKLMKNGTIKAVEESTRFYLACSSAGITLPFLCFFFPESHDHIRVFIYASLGCTALFYAVMLIRFIMYTTTAAKAKKSTEHTDTVGTDI